MQHLRLIPQKAMLIGQFLAALDWEVPQLHVGLCGHVPFRTPPQYVFKPKARSLVQLDRLHTVCLCSEVPLLHKPQTAAVLGNVLQRGARVVVFEGYQLQQLLEKLMRSFPKQRLLEKEIVCGVRRHGGHQQPTEFDVILLQLHIVFRCEQQHLRAVSRHYVCRRRASRLKHRKLSKHLARLLSRDILSSFGIVWVCNETMAQTSAHDEEPDTRRAQGDQMLPDLTPD
mmetsp:Transcript_12504/g.32767  ORF Transcript_12504/g.32767 Transcript_12504/m.32767 type:complete len:228 (-) Transcript_12504:2807-3490(-)